MRSATANQRPSTHRILLIGSHQAGLKARKILLEEKGYEVIASNKVKDAAGHLESGEFAVVIADYKLDSQTGPEFLRDVREANAKLPTILLVSPVEEISADLSNCCADVVVSKKANEVTQLLRGVERLIVRKTPRKKPSSIRRPRSGGSTAHG